MPSDDHEGAGRIVAIGASAGGVDALSTVVAGLPDRFNAAVLIVLHVSPVGTSMLPQILSRAGPLKAHHAGDGEVPKAGRIYVAPPDFHIELEPGRIRVTRGPKENGVRPAIDRLCRTAASSYGQNVVGVVLSGTLDDGTDGLIEINARGGTSVVQDPATAMFPSMPQSAAEFADPDYVVPIGELAERLTTLVGDEEAVTVSPAGTDDVQEEHGPPTEFTCPDCGGTLYEVPVGSEGLMRLRCRVGHAYSTESLLQEQLAKLESALWTAVVALEERADLADRVAERLSERLGSAARAQRFHRDSHDARTKATQIRNVILDLERSAPPDMVTEEGAS